MLREIFGNCQFHSSVLTMIIAVLKSVEIYLNEKKINEWYNRL